MGSALERILGFAEGAVGLVERALLVGSPRGELLERSTASTRRTVRAFDVLEVIEPDGEVSWVVSNGCDRATCNSAAFAERVRMSLG